MRIVGVCACPAGIAHTYMAAENLEMEAKSRGYVIKVETDGSSGVENRLTARDIEEADVVVVAADVRVDMERFTGKPLIKVSVSDAVRNVASIFQQIEASDYEIYR